MKLRAFLIVIAAGLSVVLASCDFTHVEEASQTPVDDVLSQVEQADTPAKAEQAIRTLLRKAEVGIDWKEGLYSEFELTDDEIAQLAAVHADYVAGKQQRHATFEEVYQGLIEVDRQVSDMDHWTGSRSPLNASLENVMTAFSASLSNALANPERPESTLLLAIAGDAASVLTDTTAAGKASAGSRRLDLATTYGLSPFQEILFAIWFGKHGHGCGTGHILTCPDGYNLIAKFEYGSQWIFEKPDGNEDVISMSGNGQYAYWDFGPDGGDYTVDLVRVNGGNKTYAITGPNLDPSENPYDGKLKSWYFDSWHNPDMSNVLFCEFDIPDCSSKCHDKATWKYWYYITCGKSKEEALRLAKKWYKECDASCHVQGSGGGY